MKWVLWKMIEASGEPKAQPRPRRSLRGGVYNPPSADPWKYRVAIEAAKTAPPEPIDEPVRVDVEFFFPRPKRLKGMDVPHIAKPDRDNLDKAILDTLVKAGYFRDDSLVVEGTIIKRYADPGQSPGAVIFIYREGA